MTRVRKRRYALKSTAPPLGIFAKAYCRHARCPLHATMRCQDFSVPGNCTQRQRPDALQGWLQRPQHPRSNAKALLLLFDLASNGNQAPIKETGELLGSRSSRCRSVPVNSFLNFLRRRGGDEMTRDGTRPIILSILLNVTCRCKLEMEIEAMCGYEATNTRYLDMF